MTDVFVDWSEPMGLAKKALFTAEACCTNRFWDTARHELDRIAQLLDGIRSAILLEESEAIRLKYERGGWVLHRLNDHDVAVTKPGVCPYCGGKEGEHADICAMWAAA